MSHRIDMIGFVQEPGHLYVMEARGSDASGRALFYCLCKCGHPNCRGYKITTGKKIRSGYVSSCGAREHGHSTVEAAQMGTYQKIHRGNYADGDMLCEEMIPIIKLHCFYCDVEPQNRANAYKVESEDTFSHKNGWVIYSGMDAIDPSLPHDKDNVIPACVHCNKFKLEENYEWTIDKISQLNPDFIPVFCKDLSFVSSKVKLFNETKGCENSRAKTVLGKLFPFKSNLLEGSYLNKKVSGFLGHAKDNKTRCDLTDIEVAELMLANCIYCSKPACLENEDLNTVDRYQCFIGGEKTHYDVDNCVSACYNCNSAKQQLSPEEFRAWIVRIKENLPNLPPTTDLLKMKVNNA